MFTAPGMPSNYSATEPHLPPASYLKIPIHQCHFRISWMSKSGVGSNIKKLPLRKICRVLAYHDTLMALYSWSMIPTTMPYPMISFPWGKGDWGMMGFRTLTRPGCCEHSTGPGSAWLQGGRCFCCWAMQHSHRPSWRRMTLFLSQAFRQRLTDGQSSSRLTDCFLAQKATLLTSRNLVSRGLWWPLWAEAQEGGSQVSDPQGLCTPLLNQQWLHRLHTQGCFWALPTPTIMDHPKWPRGWSWLDQVCQAADPMSQVPGSHFAEELEIKTKENKTTLGLLLGITSCYGDTQMQWVGRCFPPHTPFPLHSSGKEGRKRQA